ncbi:hypothetical protein AB9X29_003771 [Vibrio vulnificus]
MKNTLNEIHRIVAPMAMPVYLGFITTDNRIGLGEVYISQTAISKKGVTHVFKLERHLGVWCELKEFMSGLALHPQTVIDEDSGYAICLNGYFRELIKDGHNPSRAHTLVDQFVATQLPNRHFPIHSL